MTDTIREEINALKNLQMQALTAFHARVREEELQSLVGAASCAVLINDPDFLIYYATPPLEQLFGYEPRQLQGHHINKLLAERYHAAHLQGLNLYRQNPIRRSMGERDPLPALKANGEEFLAKIELIPVWPWGGAAYYIAQVFPLAAGQP